MFCHDEEGDNEGQRSPADLLGSCQHLFVIFGSLGALEIQCKEELTAVTVSMQSTKGSEVIYLESEYEYSFQSWPNRSCFSGIFV